jgi:hypothetical protein
MAANGSGMGAFLQNFVMPSVMAVNRLQMAIDAPEKYGVVAVGCELLQWYTSIEDDMEPIPVANHALAGSSTSDLLGGISYQVPTTDPTQTVAMPSLKGAGTTNHRSHVRCSQRC